MVVIQTLSDALALKGYDVLTPVQQAVTDPELEGRDLLVSAQTGSGKTVGFGLAIAETLLDSEPRFDAAAAPLALIIAPTRELAMQVNRELSWLYAQAGAIVTSCVGGMDMRNERRALERGAHIVVATPGRLRDHITRASIDLSEIRAVVLDEADEMLDLGFREDLEFILDSAPDTRRTLMFSATVPATIAKLAQTYQQDAVRVTTVSASKQHSDIAYRAMAVAAEDTEHAVINVLRYYDAENAIVFCNTRAMVNRMTTRLTNRGFSVVALSGELSQNERSHALQAMRDGRARVCVATDVAARGIDLPNLELVVHGELPTSSDTLLHRSGRTGRAGRKGVSALIVPVRSRKKAERLLSWAKLQAEWVPAPSAADVQARDEERMLADPMWQDTVTEDEQPMVEKLMGQFAPTQLAAAYLRLYHSRQSAPEELVDPDQRPAPRAERKPFGPSTWFSLGTGRKNGAEPRRLLPMICNAGGLTKDDIGAIRIQFDESFVEVKESSVAAFLKALDGKTVLEDNVTLTQLSAPPQLDQSGPAPREPRPPRDDTSAPRKPRWQPDDEPIAQPEPAPAPRAPSSYAPAPKPTSLSDDPVIDSAWTRPKPPRSDKPAPRPVSPDGDVPAHKPWAKPGDKPRGKPAGKPYAKGAGGGSDRGDSKPYGKSDDRPAGKPYSKPGDKPAGKPYGKPGERPAGKPYGKPGDKPAGKPFGKPGERPAGKPYGKPGDKPAGKSFGKPGERPAGKPFGKPGDKPAGKPFGKPGGKPAGKGFSKPSGKPAAPAPRASDTSKRFVPPKGKGGGNPPKRG